MSTTKLDALSGTAFIMAGLIHLFDGSRRHVERD